MRILILILAVLFAAGASRTPLETLEAGKGWGAVGRLELGGEGFCTATLIAPDLVLTAAHCLYAEPGDRARPLGDLEFRLGWRHGRADAYRSVAAAIAHPRYLYTASENMERRGVDIALLRLSRPVRLPGLTPFDVAPRPRHDSTVSVLAYGEASPDEPVLERACRILTGGARTLLLDCLVTPGASGAPVFAAGPEGRLRLVSVISARAEADGAPVALAALAGDALPLLRARLDGQREVAGADRLRRFQGSGGARFLSPAEP